VWEDERDGAEEVYFGRPDTAGVSFLEQVRVTVEPQASDEGSIALGAGTFCVCWEQSVLFQEQIFCTRLNDSGVRTEGDVIITDIVGGADRPKVAWNGELFAVAWQDGRDGHEIYFSWVGEAGRTSDANLLVSGDPSRSVTPAMASSGSRFAVVWADDRDGNWEIYLRLLAP
jgi:hypothetical protein